MIPKAKYFHQTRFVKILYTKIQFYKSKSNKPTINTIPNLHHQIIRIENSSLLAPIR